MFALQVLAAVHGCGWLVFGVVTLWTIPADEVRKHALAAFLTAIVCGFIWPVLLFKDVTGRERS